MWCETDRPHVGIKLAIWSHWEREFIFFRVRSLWVGSSFQHLYIYTAVHISKRHRYTTKLRNARSHMPPRSVSGLTRKHVSNWRFADHSQLPIYAWYEHTISLCSSAWTHTRSLLQQRKWRRPKTAASTYLLKINNNKKYNFFFSSTLPSYRLVDSRSEIAIQSALLHTVTSIQTYIYFHFASIARSSTQKKRKKKRCGKQTNNLFPFRWLFRPNMRFIYGKCLTITIKKKKKNVHERIDNKWKYSGGPSDCVWAMRVYGRVTQIPERYTIN